MNFISLIFAVASGGCLLAIAFRKKIPFWGALYSQKIQVKLDNVDKLLAFSALVGFCLCLLFLMI